jgi:myosin heavy subunit
MKMNSSGKTLVIFLVIVAVLLISLTAMSIFIFQKEIEKRKKAENEIEVLKTVKMNLERDLKDAKKQNFILEEKNKEADERINSLLDEIELETGLREEMTSKYNEAKEQLSRIKEQKEKNEKDLQEQLQKVSKKASVLEEKLDKEIQTKEELRGMIKEIESKNKELNEKLQESEASAPSSAQPQAKVGTSPPAEGINLDKIVIAPKSMSEGRILSVDKETEFVILNLGQKDGIQKNMLLSVVRDGNYLGDIKVTRLHPEMSAADLIPPFSIQVVRQNDKVVVKK